jgi:hypothetical protein
MHKNTTFKILVISVVMFLIILCVDLSGLAVPIYENIDDAVHVFSLRRNISNFYVKNLMGYEPQEIVYASTDDVAITNDGRMFIHQPGGWVRQKINPIEYKSYFDSQGMGSLIVVKRYHHQNRDIFVINISKANPMTEVNDSLQSDFQSVRFYLLKGVIELDHLGIIYLLVLSQTPDDYKIVMNEQVIYPLNAKR